MTVDMRGMAAAFDVTTDEIHLAMSFSTLFFGQMGEGALRSSRPAETSQDAQDIALRRNQGAVNLLC